MFNQTQNTENNNGIVNQTGSGLPNNQKKAGKKTGLAVILLGLLGIGVVGAPYIWDSLKGSDEAEEQKTNTAIKTQKAYTPPVEEEKSEIRTFSFDEPEEPEAPIEKLGDPVQVQQPQEMAQRPKLVKSITGDMMNKYSSFSGGEVKDPYAQAEDEDQLAVNNAIAQANAYLAQNQGGNEPNEKIESRQGDIFSAPTFEATTARKSKYNPNLLLEQGTLIPCALRVRVISNISGQISCNITENVYSSNGNVLLIDKGSRVNGYYQGNSVAHGSSQLFVVWQEVRTPDHLVIPLNSGSTDELGANGLNGWVDNHFWERFSNAIFLSMILDGNNILLSKMTDTEAKNSENTREAGKEIATTVLEQMGDIKPTLYKNQGDKVGIFVARDVDFSGVYQLKRSR